MGNGTSGIGVLNLSSYTLHMGISYGTISHYENNVQHGEIFYRYDGPGYSTVFAETAPRQSDGKHTANARAKPTILGVSIAEVAAGITTVVICPPALSALSGPAPKGKAAADTCAGDNAAKTNYVVSAALLDVLDAVSAADLYVERKECYSRNPGTWLVLRGGLRRVNGKVKHERLRLEIAEPEYVLNNGKFTLSSFKKFYTNDEASRHKTAGHSCARAACAFLSSERSVKPLHLLQSNPWEEIEILK